MSYKVLVDGFNFEFTDSNYFRFSAEPGYKALSGNSFKEMDVCWFDQLTNRLWLIELKDYTSASAFDAAQGNTSDKRMYDILTKSVHSLQMVLACQHGYPYSTKFVALSQLPLDRHTSLAFVTIVRSSIFNQQYVGDIDRVYQHKFRPYTQLFDIKFCGVLTLDSAQVQIAKGNIPFQLH